MSDKSQLIKVEKAIYDKPVAVIYNPASGKRKDIRKTIADKLSAESIEVKFYDTERQMHAWELAEKDIDFEQHSALIAVGGDGTLHEVINGMLMREDGRRLPVAFVPNGSGNDVGSNMGYWTVDESLNHILS